MVFGILARDCRESLKRNIPRIQEAGTYFDDYRVVIYENDSVDGTDSLIREWMDRNDKVFGVCDTTGQENIPAKSSFCPYPAKSVHRIERMSCYRNRLLCEVEKRFSPDLVCFVDIDILDFNPLSLAKAVLSAPVGWGGLFANGRVLIKDFIGNESFSPFQYDSYAFLDDGFNYQETGGWFIRRHFHSISSYVLNRKVSETPFLPCSSAFNGIGIYRWEAIRGLRYRVEQTPELKAVNACFCEHVPFNAEVK